MQDGNPIEGLDDDNATSSAPFGLFGITPQRSPVIAITASAAMNRTEAAAIILGAAEPKSHDGHDYFAANDWAVAFPSDQTLLFGSEGGSKHCWADAETESAGGVSNQLRSAGQPFDGARRRPDVSEAADGIHGCSRTR